MLKMSRILRVRKRGAVWARNSVPQMILTMRFCRQRILFKLEIYSEHVRAKLIKANKCLFVLRSLRKEGFSQGEVDHLFSALVLPNFTYGLPVYGAVNSDLKVIQNFLGRCFKRKYTSKRMDIRELLEKADKKLFKVRSVDPDCPLSNIIPKKKETKYDLIIARR